MNDMPFHCGQRIGEDISLCPALTQLKQEHIPLREQMEQTDRYKHCSVNL
ncbi:hypothetical protein JIR001_25370 [Polycladomyces abyssicola]|uniref:Uncharacterized protein n=1 Tax=Polycladomyces abyssicola TaxID=1125966 RepID=A0A8D5ZLP8_9BACL|nr:hypothetical protein JIR001_25370 [Polycladomyces abyssicola]